MITIDRESPIPLYFQIASDLRQNIQRGDWLPNHRIPTEADLAVRYGVSRMTVRQSLAVLSKEGLLIRKRRVGASVKSDAHIAPLSLTAPSHFALRLREYGLTPSVKVIQSEVQIVPSAEIAQHLKIKAEGKVSYFKRLLLGNNQPIALTISILPYALCPKLTRVPLIDDSISKTLAQKFDLKPSQAKHWIEAVRASAEEAQILDTQPDAPLLRFSALYYSADGSPMQFSNTSWVGDRLRLSVEVISLASDG